MKRNYFLVLCFAFFSCPLTTKADFWGGDLPLLAQIVTNTLMTLRELERQSTLLSDQMEGIKDKIERIRTISELVQPSSWEDWKDPNVAIRRLREIYFTLPKEYRSEKADEIERELSRAMNAISRISGEAHTTFLSGKELERRGADSSPGVAEKLTASGVGTLVAMEAQTQIIQSHITSLLAQILADSNEREARSIVAAGSGYASLSTTLSQKSSAFSDRVFSFGGKR